MRLLSIMIACPLLIPGGHAQINALRGRASISATFGGVSITQASPLPSATLGLPYSLTLSATGGTSPYTWALSHTVSVASFGAVGDGTTDDTAHIQAAIDSLAASGGGTLFVPAGTYLLNSTHAGAHPWFFYNLLMGSNITIQGANGAKFLQGSGGRHAVVSGATYVRNTVLAIGPDYAEIRFQDPAVNGGFYTLNATTAGSSVVTLATHSESANFTAGDYVAVYATTTGDQIPGETSQVLSVNIGAGTITLAWPLARSFVNGRTLLPSIVNVTALATVNVGINNLTIEGAEPLAATEVFGFRMDRCHITADTSAANNAYSVNLNTIRDFTLTNNTFDSVGSPYVNLEMPQRNSQTGYMWGNTFIVSSARFGEYAAHWQIFSNAYQLHPDTVIDGGIVLGGLDIEFNGNTVTTLTDLSGGAPWGSIIADFAGTDDYAAYVGSINVVNNTVQCVATGNSCILVRAPDTRVSNNVITATGTANGIHAEGPLAAANQFTGNTVSLGSGSGIILVGTDPDGSAMVGNTLSGSGTYGIFVSSPSTPNSGIDRAFGNTISGFGTATFLDVVKHPAAVLSSDGSTYPAMASGAFRSLTFPGLCTGLALSTSGVISGTPTVGQTCSFGVTATDSMSLFGLKLFTLTVGSGGISVGGRITMGGKISH